MMTEKLGNKIQIVGDDLFVTNTKFLKKSVKRSANSYVKEPNLRSINLIFHQKFLQMNIKSI